MNIKIKSFIKGIIQLKRVINYALIIILFILFSCKETEIPVQESGLFHQTVMVDGLNRKYAIYIPSDIESISVPLIFELHGGGIYIEDMTGESGYKTPYKLWMTLAESEKFIVVYPEGMNGAYDKPTWNDCRGDCIVSSDVDDVHFIETLIDIISDNHNVNQNRIYISGTSNGGFMALRLAVEKSNKIAAVAAIAAAMPAVSECYMPVSPISVLFMNGTNDNHMPYTGGYVSNPPNPDYGSALSTDSSIKFWQNFNHTDTIAQRYVFPDLDSTDGGIVERFSYKNGKQGTEVVLYKINGGGHSAPSIQEQYSELFEQYFNKQNHDIEMTKEVWNFFKNKSLK